MLVQITLNGNVYPSREKERMRKVKKRIKREKDSRRPRCLYEGTAYTRLVPRGQVRKRTRLVYLGIELCAGERLLCPRDRAKPFPRRTIETPSRATKYFKVINIYQFATKQQKKTSFEHVIFHVTIGKKKSSHFRCFVLNPIFVLHRVHYLINDTKIFII